MSVDSVELVMICALIAIVFITVAFLVFVLLNKEKIKKKMEENRRKNRRKKIYVSDEQVEEDLVGILTPPPSSKPHTE